MRTPPTLLEQPFQTWERRPFGGWSVALRCAALEDVVSEAATRAGYQSHFFAQKNTIEDDHLPFVKRGVPCADLIDLSYGYNNVFWHTPQDTVDKLSPKSMEIVGTVILETIRILDRMEPLPPK